MRDDVTIQSRLSLVGRMHKMIPAISGLIQCEKSSYIGTESSHCLDTMVMILLGPLQRNHYINDLSFCQLEAVNNLDTSCHLFQTNFTGLL